LAKSFSYSLFVDERINLLAFQDVVIDEQAKLEKLEREKIETRGKLRIYLLLSGIVVFIVIVFLLYRNNQHRKKTNETLRQRNEKIENALHQLRSTQTQLIQSEKMASLGELTAGIAHEIQNPLNFVNNFSEVSNELIDEMKSELATGNLLLATEIANDVKQNLEKISHHGKRADAIVKGMLQHSRAATGKKEPTGINALADEYLRFAYHGLRAKHQEFNATIQTDFDNSIGKISAVPQDMGRVLLNLYNNAFYAVAEKQKKSIPGYQPLVTVITKRLGSPLGDGGRIEIKVTDNGNGIPQNIVDKIFQPFFTTKPTGQGTGLGLSLSYDIIKAHGGEIKVETKDGDGSTFIIQLNS
jgi:signal transduction histidine kinase